MNQSEQTNVHIHVLPYLVIGDANISLLTESTNQVILNNI